MALFHRTFAIMMGKCTTAFPIKCTKLRYQGDICSFSSSNTMFEMEIPIRTRHNTRAMAFLLSVEHLKKLEFL